MPTDITFDLGIFADGVGGTKDASAIIQSDSTTQGVLIPRMDETARDTITSVPLSLRIFNTTSNQFEFHNGSAWVAVGASATVSAENVTIATGVGSPTIDQMQEYIDSTGSAGFFIGGTVSDGGSGTIDVAAGSGFIRTSASSTAQLVSFKWAASSGIAVTDNTTQYIFVDDTGTINLNADEFIEAEDNIIIGLATDEGGAIVSVYNLGVRLDESIGQAGRYIRRVFGVKRDVRRGGLIITETGTRNLILSTGHLLWGRTDYIIPALNTSVSDTFTTYSITGQEASAATQWDNLQYDNAGTLTTMTNNRWANHYFYLEPDGDLTMIYGRAQYTTQALAEDESAPTSSLPNKLTAASVLTARLTFLKSAATGTISSAFDTVFSGSGSSATEFSDDVFRINDNGDNTKQFAYEVGNISPATTRTHTVRDIDGFPIVDSGADGTSGQTLTSNGAGVLPTWQTAAGSGDVVKVGTPVNNQLGVWTGDGTIEGDTALTFDSVTNTLAIAASGDLAFGAVSILNDSAGTTTLQNIDALDTATLATIEAAVTALVNLVTTGTITTGVWSATDIAVAAGGTGSSTASGARTNLGLVIGTNVQAWDTNLDNVSGTNTGDEAAASTTVSGISELATTAETSAGTDTARTIPVSALPLQIQDNKYTFAVDAEVSDTYVITLTPAPSAYVAGQIFSFDANTANTGAATLNVNSLGAKAILKNHDVVLADGDIEASQLVVVQYDGTQFQMISQLGNAAAGGGGGGSYAILTDEKSTGTDGGTASNNTWNARDLNTELADPDNIVSISSNQFTPVSGTYKFHGKAPSLNTTRHKLRLYNVTAASVVQEGSSAWSSGGGAATLATLDHRFTANGTDAYRIDHWTNTSGASSDLGLQTGDGSPETYLVIILEQE